MTDVPNNNKADPKINSNGTSQLPHAEQAKTNEKLKPEIASFFAPETVSVNNFFKCVRDAGISHFQPADQEHTTELMKANDPFGDRLWSIVSQSNQPNAVHYWMWKAVQERFKGLSEDSFNHQIIDTDIFFQEIINFVQDKIKSDDQNEKKAALNWLRLGIAWLIEKRAIEPWKVLSRIDDLFFDKVIDAQSAAKRLIRNGKHSEFTNAVAVSIIAKDTVASAVNQSRQDRIVASDLRERLTNTTTEMDKIKSKLVLVQNELAELSKKYQDAHEQYEIDRQHWGHNLTEVEASHNVLMQKHIRSDLQDALDALEIEAPALKVALSRLKSALKMIDEAKRD